MKILFATRRGHVPERLGGSQQCMHALLTTLQQRGYACEAVATLQPGPRLWAYRMRRRLSSRRWLGSEDRRAGYSTYRAWEHVVPQLLRARLEIMRPDVVVADFQHDNRVAEEAVRAGVPTLLRAVSASCVERHAAIPDSPHLLAYANSSFVASRLRAQYGIEPPIVYPFLRFDAYVTERPHPEYITFINPLPSKGVDTALEVAKRLPHRRFLFVQGALTRREAATLKARIARHPNVRLEPPTRDMRPVYARTLVLLVPSTVEETFGRVVLEGQINGIPAVARHIGGLPEAVGAGGVLMPREASADDWAASVEGILSDASLAGRLSRAARANAARPEFSLEHNMTRFLEIAQAHVRASAGTRTVLAS